MDVFSCCRLCLNPLEKVTFNIFNDKVLDEQLSAVILNVTSIKITEDETVSNVICSTCHFSILHFSIFRRSCLQNNRRFLAHVKQIKNISSSTDENVCILSDDEDGDIEVPVRTAASTTSPSITNDEEISLVVDSRVCEKVVESNVTSSTCETKEENTCDNIAAERLKPTVQNVVTESPLKSPTVKDDPPPCVPDNSKSTLNTSEFEEISDDDGFGAADLDDLSDSCLLSEDETEETTGKSTSKSNFYDLTASEEIIDLDLIPSHKTKCTCPPTEIIDLCNEDVEKPGLPENQLVLCKSENLELAVAKHEVIEMKTELIPPKQEVLEKSIFCSSLPISITLPIQDLDKLKRNSERRNSLEEFSNTLLKESAHTSQNKPPPTKNSKSLVSSYKDVSIRRIEDDIELQLLKLFEPDLFLPVPDLKFLRNDWFLTKFIYKFEIRLELTSSKIISPDISPKRWKFNPELRLQLMLKENAIERGDRVTSTEKINFGKTQNYLPGRPAKRPYKTYPGKRKLDDFCSPIAKKPVRKPYKLHPITLDSPKGILKKTIEKFRELSKVQGNCIKEGSYKTPPKIATSPSRSNKDIITTSKAIEDSNYIKEGSYKSPPKLATSPSRSNKDIITTSKVIEVSNYIKERSYKTPPKIATSPLRSNKDIITTSKVIEVSNPLQNILNEMEKPPRPFKSNTPSPVWKPQKISENDINNSNKQNSEIPNSHHNHEICKNLIDSLKPVESSKVIISLSPSKTQRKNLVFLNEFSNDNSDTEISPNILNYSDDSNSKTNSNPLQIQPTNVMLTKNSNFNPKILTSNSQSEKIASSLENVTISSNRPELTESSIPITVTNVSKSSPQVVQKRPEKELNSVPIIDDSNTPINLNYSNNQNLQNSTNSNPLNSLYRLTNLNPSFNNSTPETLIVTQENLNQFSSTQNCTLSNSNQSSYTIQYPQNPYSLNLPEVSITYDNSNSTTSPVPTLVNQPPKSKQYPIVLNLLQKTNPTNNTKPSSPNISTKSPPPKLQSNNQVSVIQLSPSIPSKVENNHMILKDLLKNTPCTTIKAKSVPPKVTIPSSSSILPQSQNRSTIIDLDPQSPENQTDTVESNCMGLDIPAINSELAKFQNAITFEELVNHGSPTPAKLLSENKEPKKITKAAEKKSKPVKRKPSTNTPAEPIKQRRVSNPVIRNQLTEEYTPDSYLPLNLNATFLPKPYPQYNQTPGTSSYQYNQQGIQSYPQYHCASIPTPVSSIPSSRPVVLSDIPVGNSQYQSGYFSQPYRGNVNYDMNSVTYQNYNSVPYRNQYYPNANGNISSVSQESHHQQRVPSYPVNKPLSSQYHPQQSPNYATINEQCYPPRSVPPPPPPPPYPQPSRQNHQPRPQCLIQVKTPTAINQSWDANFNRGYNAH